jgi:hypothetical protein
VLTEPGMEKVVDSAPGHVEAVRRLVIDPLTAGQLDGVREAGDLIQARIERGGGGRPAR